MKKTKYPNIEPHQFKPGESGNPHGRPPLNPIQKALRELTIKTYRDVIEAVLVGNIDQLKVFITDPKSPAIKVGVATALLKAIKAGDYTVIERITERIVGKIPDVVKLESRNTHINKIDPVKLKAALDQLEEDV